ncbi:demethylmenaquinone methyltransferase / 2-methoxy-6-polyprenyl-1,4-benzoquinol methylase [Anaerolineae bacterium]|nr:demethylmenaquinone methyltransferase / 2-methoxy-6-polyprenyl-1,4-benzoquinol methylase [Anaerolineae bacterium]
MNRLLRPSHWPKTIPTLTLEQQRIRDDFMRHWLEVLPNRFGIIEEFNHGYPLSTFKPGCRTLEIGAGLGAHLRFEKLDQQEYTALELRAELANALAAKFPGVRALVGDCQKHIDAPDRYFDRVLAIHVLEHLPDLPRALDEIKRVLKPNGFFSVLIPCEGGLAYTLARNISARRIFEQRYKQSYDWCIASEHINVPSEILPELRARFRVVHQTHFPLWLPIMTANLVIGLTLTRGS